MRIFFIIGIVLLLVGHVLAKSPLDPSRILEFPTIYIYPYYWVLPITDSVTNAVPDSNPSIEDMCRDSPETSKPPVLAF